MQKYAVITGASSGIGKEMAKELDSRGYRTILIARRKEQLEKVATSLKHEAMIIVADLSLEEECYRVYEDIKDKHIEVFINNAGMGDYGYFLDNDLNKELSMININIKALHILTKLILQHMYKNDHGYILNVASSAGLMSAGPYMSTYYATKSYVTSLTLGIAQELHENQKTIYIGCLCPGPIDTEFNKTANIETGLHGISASYCAQYAIKKMFDKKKIIIPTLSLRIAMTLNRFLPISLSVKIASHQQKKKAKKK